MKQYTNEEIDQIADQKEIYTGAKAVKEIHTEFWDMRFSNNYKESVLNIQDYKAGLYVPEEVMEPAVIYLAKVKAKALTLITTEEFAMGLAKEPKKEGIANVISRLDTELSRVDKLIEDIEL